MQVEQLYYGAAYYDEYMPVDRIEKDMEMMARAGMNVIRIAESTWSTWEAEEGRFDFTHLHRMLDAAKRHGIKVIVGTPTYAIPYWLAQKEEGVLATNHGGKERYGHRQNMDITNPTYLHHAKIIIEKLMEEVKDEPHVIGFQLDNETKHYDTCSERAQKMFVERLKEEFHGDLDAMNAHFGFNYWSNRIASWDAFPDVRGTINQSYAAAYSKFQRSLVTEFLAWQSKIVEAYKREDQFITQNFDFEWHNYSFGLQPEVNQYEAAKATTVAGCDIYHPTEDHLTGEEITVCGNIARGLKNGQNYLLLETEAQGNPGWLPYPGQLRLQAYSHIANGANSVLYWHWHSIHNAIETYWKGVLSHDLKENETYRDCCQIGNEWKAIGARIANLQKENKVAVVADNEALTGMTLFPTATKKEHSYSTVFRWVCDTLYHKNIEYDVIPADADRLKQYELVIVPALYSACEDYLHALNQYVEQGGNMIVTYKSGFADKYLRVYPETQPHIIHEALGITYDQFTLPENCGVSYQGVRSEAREWQEMVQTTTATSWANYEHAAWKAYAAITCNHYGEGHALYLGTLFDEAVLSRVLDDFIAEAGITLEKAPVEAEYPVCVKQGINAMGEKVIYLLNYSGQEMSVKLKKDAKVILDAASRKIGDALPKQMEYPLGECAMMAGSEISLEPWGVVILAIS